MTKRERWRSAKITREALLAALERHKREQGDRPDSDPAWPGAAEETFGSQRAGAEGALRAIKRWYGYDGTEAAP